MLPRRLLVPAFPSLGSPFTLEGYKEVLAARHLEFPGTTPAFSSLVRHWKPELKAAL
ncbi:hypothetical protein BDN71DRAFT_1456150 [Pleurotus eryngii]|uniref:Uncharacterized protein n=1 Tax=Pleurotus eryngii TaxID=5323 RepID=A0A9P6DA88_PLEER|nr:hypothetical protein BDN71DRAFT_1456150 [Pleurotus eryngii]